MAEPIAEQRRASMLLDAGTELCITCGIAPVPASGQKCYQCCDDAVKAWRAEHPYKGAILRR